MSKRIRMPSSTSTQVALILLVGGLSFFTRLGEAKLWDRDEPRNAQCAREMLESGDWIVPTFNGELRTHKPIMLYWLMRASYRAWGVNEFAARFASALLSLGTVLATYWLGRQLADAKSATWGAIVLATTLMFNVAAHAATPDAALIFFSTSSLVCLFASVQPTGNGASHRSPRRRWQWGGWILMGCGVLTKGPIGLFFPLSIWTLYCWLRTPLEPTQVNGEQDSGWNRLRQFQFAIGFVRRRWTWAHLRGVGQQVRPVSSCLVALLIAAPWYVAVGVRTDGVWLSEFFLQHNVGRAMQPMEGHHGGPWFYFVAILVGFFPWSALTIPVVLWWIADDRRRDGAGSRGDGDLLLFSWIVVYVGVFTIAATKLPSYVTPAYPAIALLIGRFIAVWPESTSGPARWWPRWSAATLIIVGVMMSAGLPIAAHYFLPGNEWLGILGLIPTLGGVACLVSFWRDRIQEGMVGLAVTSLGFVLGLFAVLAPQVSRSQQIELLVHHRDVRTEGCLTTYGVHEPSWVFYAQQTVPFLNLDEEDQLCSQLLVEENLAIMTADTWREVQERLPDDIQILQQVPYFLRSQQLVLVGHAPAPTDVAHVDRDDSTHTTYNR